MSMCFAHVFEVLLPDAPGLIERVSHCAFTEIRGFARDSHDSAIFLAIAPQVDDLQDIDCH